MEDLKCKFLGFKVTGASYIHLWGGGHGCIEMTSYLVEKEEDIIHTINDGGFGCERIEYAFILVYAQYEYNATKFLYKKFVNLLNPNEEVPLVIQEELIESTAMC